MKAHTIYGPPGCGKTTEMLRRVAESSKVVAKNEICYLSFTKAGAAEALKRLNLTRSNTICTVHSLMFRLTNCSGGSVVDFAKLRELTNKTGFRFRGTSNDTAEQMETGDQYLDVLSLAKNRMSDLRTAYYESSRPGNFAEFEFFAKTYAEWKKQNGYVDFNDMLERYLKNPVNHGTKHVYIDEAQDLSDLQWRVIDKVLSYEQVEEVHVAGDDDQAIYEWSGANTHGMAEFEDRYGAERTVLEQSWRVPSLVHALAVDVVGRITQRVDKVYRPRSEAGEVRRFGRLDTKRVRAGSDLLVLCRNYVTREEVEADLIRERIPYKNDGGTISLFDGRVAQAIRVILRLQKGESVTDADIERVSLVATDQTKRELAARDFGPMLRRGHMRSLKVRPEHAEFYRDADFSRVPTIRLSTIHGAKGREADHVILHTGLTMKTLKDMDNNPDAEARVFYVAVTRARHTLDIIEGENGYGL